MWNTLIRSWKESKQVNKLILLASLYVLLGILSLISSYSIGRVTQSAIFLNTGIIKKSLTLLIIASLLHITIEWFTNIYKSKINQKMISDFKTHTAYSLLKSKYSFSQNLQQGDIIGRMNSDITSIVLATDLSLMIVKSMIVLLILTMGLFIINWKLLLAFFLPVPFLFLAQYWTATKSAENIIPWKEAMGATNGLTQDLINNRTTIKAFRLEGRVMDWTDKALKNSAKKGILGVGKLYLLGLLPIGLMFLPVFSLAGAGIYLVYKGNLSLEALVTAFMIVQLVISEFNILENAFQNIPQLLASTERIFPLWDSPKEESGEFKGNNFDKNLPVIKFENVSFSYPSDKEDNKIILNNLSFEIKFGEKVGLVGSSGSGKSTIFKLITGLYQADSGRIEVLGKNIENWDKSSLRKNISMVSQNTYLFDESIINNLKYAKEDINESDAYTVIKKANLDEFLNSLTHSLDTSIGEKGSKLSGGQRQRLAIARAFVRNSPLLLLDEATSALDVETEKEIQKTLENSSEEETHVVIAHRFSSIVNLDRILVLDKGKLVEEGSHRDLLRNKGLYASLYYKKGGEENNGNK